MPGGFKGVVYAVNPNHQGDRRVSLACRISGSLPSPPDLAVLAVRSERLEDAMKAAVAAGAKAAVIFASAQLANDGAAHAWPTGWLRSLGNARMPVCGANCMGFYNDLDNVWVCGFPSPRRPEPGAIALIAHSGSVFGALAHNDPRLRFALAISPGAGATTTHRRLYQLMRWIGRR